MEQRFQSGEGATRLELILSRSGFLIGRADHEEIFVTWDQISEIRYHPPAQEIELGIGNEQRIIVPFELCGEDGDFDDFLNTVLNRSLPDEKEIDTHWFGRFDRGKIALWLSLAVIGSALSILWISSRTHWLISIAIAGLWLMSVRYGALGRECLLRVTKEGLKLRKLWWGRTIPFRELSKLSVHREKKSAKQTILILEVGTRTGERELLTSLGESTIEAFQAIRSSVRHRTSS